MYPSFTEHELKDAIIWLVMRAKDIDEEHKWRAMLDKDIDEEHKWHAMLDTERKEAKADEVRNTFADC